MSLKFLVGIFLAAILTENYILNKFSASVRSSAFPKSSIRRSA